ncbi:MAG: PorV/PorQ family protein [Elusimicrobia bacterium]|nr:PorV/PorQ family protein [Elusimicrobiota bacterium]
MNFLLVSLLVCAGHAEDFHRSGRGTAAAGFLNLGVGGRAMGMGEAYTAVADEAHALYWNPAGLALTPRQELVFTHATYLGSGFYDYAASVYRVGRGGLAAGVQHMSYGTVEETDASGSVTGQVSPRELTAALGMAYAISPVAFGVSAKYVRSRLVRKAETAAVDLGLMLRLHSRLRFGVAARNIGGDLKYDEERFRLPLSVRAGLMAKLNPWWLVSAEGVVPRSNGPYGAFGTEVRLANQPNLGFALRAGYNSRTLRGVDGAAGATGGFGVAFGGWAVDYAVVPFGSVGMSHVASVSVQFGSGVRKGVQAPRASFAK